MTDFDGIDFFHAHGPVWREPHHGVVIVTGCGEVVAVLNDTTSFSNCSTVSGRFAKFPVPLEGDDVDPRS